MPGELTKKRCVPCEGRVPSLDASAIALLLPEVPAWQLRATMITRSFSFRDFLGAIAFVNRMAQLAEDEGHHPDFSVHYNRVDVSLTTHAASGLTENDFIVAAKIDAMVAIHDAG